MVLLVSFLVFVTVTQKISDLSHTGLNNNCAASLNELFRFAFISTLFNNGPLSFLNVNRLFQKKTAFLTSTDTGSTFAWLQPNLCSSEFLLTIFTMHHSDLIFGQSMPTATTFTILSSWYVAGGRRDVNSDPHCLSQRRSSPENFRRPSPQAVSVPVSDRREWWESLGCTFPIAVKPNPAARKHKVALDKGRVGPLTSPSRIVDIPHVSTHGHIVKLLRQ